MVIAEKTKNSPNGNKQADQDYSDNKVAVLDSVYCFEVYISKLHIEIRGV